MAENPLGRLMEMPRNPARAPGPLEKLIADATVNPLWELAQGVGAAASGYGNSPEAGAGLMAGIGIMSPMQRLIKPIRAYHGSPHDFDKFDISKIGTGEGAQSYGHGLYFAGKEATAKSYSDKLGAQMYRHSFDTSEAAAKWALGNSRGDLQKAIETIKANILARSGSQPSKESQAFNEALGLLESGKITSPGKMYEVDIHARPEQFLDWDKPLGAQPHLLPQLNAAGVTPKNLDTSPLAKYGDWGSAQAQYLNDMANKPGSQLYMDAGLRAGGYGRDYGKAATPILEQAGIPGIKYLDQGSRGAGEGTSNYVLFNDSIIEIMKKYGLTGAVAGPLGALLAGGNNQAQAGQ